MMTPLAGLLSNNQFLSGGLVLGFLGSLVALLHKTPIHAWRWLHLRLTVSVEVQSSDPAYQWLEAWLAQIPYAKRNRRFDACTLRSGNGESLGVVLVPAAGLHWFRFNGRLVWLVKHRGDAPISSSTPGVGTQRNESFRLTVLSRRQDIIAEILELAHRAKDEREVPTCFTNSSEYWERIGRVPDRPIDSVILPKGCSEALLEDMRHFLTAGEEYRKLGIPYRRSFLLHGPPGTGKSSLVTALAHELKLDVYVLGMGASWFDDERLRTLLARVGGKAILLLEDVDAVRAATKVRRSDDDSKDGGRVTRSGLLNSLDGLVAPTGLIVCMTTNHRSKLDPALLRPGRVDKEVEFKAATDDQILDLYTRFFPESTGENQQAFVESFSKAPTMAEVQQRCLAIRNGTVVRKSRRVA